MPVGCEVCELDVAETELVLAVVDVSVVDADLLVVGDAVAPVPCETYPTLDKPLPDKVPVLTYQHCGGKSSWNRGNTSSSNAATICEGTGQANFTAKSVTVATLP